jgi:hypothetical protein
VHFLWVQCVHIDVLVCRNEGGKGEGQVYLSSGEGGNLPGDLALLPGDLALFAGRFGSLL